MHYPIYLDYNATTPVDQRVLDVMLPYLTTHFGNAASRTHVFGLKAEEGVDRARRQVAALLGALPNELVFTSGATESINLALKGVFEANTHRGNHIITVATEHKAVLDTCQHLEQLGAEVTYLPPGADGLISVEQVAAALRPDTILISVMLANNETGVIQPLADIAALAKQHNSLVHTDATQAVGKLPINLADLPVDLLSFSGHKFYAPKGIGGLFVRQKTRLVAQQDGGRHERGRRSGTLNVPGIVAMGQAAELAQTLLVDESSRLTQLRDRLEAGILAQLPGVQVTGSKSHRLPNTTNLAFAQVDGEALLMSLNDIAVSNGSACTAASTDPSHVLKAMGLPDDLAYSSVRFSLGRFTTETDIEQAIQQVVQVVSRLRNVVSAVH
ncbi:cysteine desulfurase family protein [Fibrivirga algicola]|uniref:cysteine desulfurase n=1 Tax=Fibrivirga algicola TaxID=2950420 RepID=A0ABX0Q978_9BACT|nr:cysteine desulfurase family protein [Fibrivirga algicola]NID08604.1 cysteine desulfurase [Fibrivirga algicola]